MKGRKNRSGRNLSRRDFLKGSAAVTAGAALAAPTILPSCVTGAKAPSETITLGVIGTGRIANSDMDEIMKLDGVRIVAVCDVDSWRMNQAGNKVNNYYTKKLGRGSYKGVAMYGDYRALVENPGIDAVMICTPDHWHALPAVAAAEAGKDIFIQKPLTLTIKEGRILSDAVRRSGRVLQVGSQQRSHPAFHQACELVRNGRIGKLERVLVGLPGDPGCGEEPEMPVPAHLDYDMWLGSTPQVPYTEKRVHPDKSYSRPGWLRIQAYGAGMITGWGSHHLDTAQWGMGTEFSGPQTIEATAQFPESGLWDVHGDFRIEYTYASGVKLICADNKRHQQGVRFEGTEGWIYVRRWKIDAEPKSILTSEIKENEIHLYKSIDHKKNFLDCIRSREETVAPVEVGHRSCTVCLLGSIAMNLGRKLQWDPKTERFINDDEANGMASREMRKPWSF